LSPNAAAIFAALAVACFVALGAEEMFHEQQAASPVQAHDLAGQANDAESQDLMGAKDRTQPCRVTVEEPPGSEPGAACLITAEMTESQMEAWGKREIRKFPTPGSGVLV
jgi:hypothetical protein